MNSHQVVEQYANWLAEQGRVDDAEALYDASLALLEKTDPTSRQIVVLMRNLADFCVKHKKADKGRNVLVTALEFARKTYGAEDKDSALILMDFGRMYYEQKDYEKAEKYLLFCTRIHEKLSMTSEPDYKKAWGMLHEAYQHLGKGDKKIESKTIEANGSEADLTPASKA